MNRLCPRGSFTFVKSYSVWQRYFVLLRYTLPIGSFLCNDQHAGLWYGYSTKARNYYDVLELTPKATDIQIKSAYYRLSKKYHPDKNPSKESKAMFTEIAEAYETLGNKRLRKLYDSNQTGSFVREGHTMSNASPFSQHKSRRKPPMGRSNVYNFDEFYRQHYGDVRMGKQMRREAYEEAMKERRELIERKNTVIVVILISTVTVLLINIFTLYKSH